MGSWLFGCDDLLKWDCEAGCEKGAASIEFILECESGNACSNRGTCTLKALNGSNDDSNDDDDCDDVIINGLAWVDSGGDNCSSYEENGWCCEHGNNHENNGFVALEACCSCGGGSTAATGDYICTCNPDLGGGWGGKDCELCNGADPQPDPREECDGITLDDCDTRPDLLRVCPQTCGGMCFTSTTTATPTTTTTTTTTTATTATTTTALLLAPLEQTQGENFFFLLENDIFF